MRGSCGNSGQQEGACPDCEKHDRLCTWNKVDDLVFDDLVSHGLVCHVIRFPIFGRIFGIANPRFMRMDSVEDGEIGYGEEETQDTGEEKEQGNAGERGQEIDGQGGAGQENDVHEDEVQEGNSREDRGQDDDTLEVGNIQETERNATDGDEQKSQ